MNVGAPFVTDADFPIIMEPSKQTFDGPTLFSQPTSMLGVALGQFGNDLFPFEPFSMRLRIVTSISQLLFRSFLVFRSFLAPASITSAFEFGNRLDQGFELGDVVAVGTCDFDR